jgi:hypothetical protein
MIPAEPVRLTMDLNGWVGAFHLELEGLLSDMIQLCRAAEQNRYTNTVMNQRGGVQMMIPNAQALGENAPQRAARNAFLGAMSKFNGFLDRLIASRNIARDGIPITRDLCSEAELLAYVNEMIDQGVAAVARDHRLTFPRKLDSFTGLDASIGEMAISYNKLRNALEHHHDLPKEEIRVKVRRMIPMVGDQEIKDFPVLVPKGGTMGIKIEEEERTFPANTRIVLSSQDAYDLIFTIRYIISLAIYQWHVGAGNPKVTGVQT